MKYFQIKAFCSISVDQKTFLFLIYGVLKKYGIEVLLNDLYCVIIMSGTIIFQKRKASLRELVWLEIDQRCTANKPPKIIKATLSHLAYSFLSLFLFPPLKL